MLTLAAAVGLLGGEPANANSGKKRVVILGDSITAGYGIDPDHAYPALIQQKIDARKLPYTVTNAGVSGDTTAGGLRRIEWVLGPQGADLLVLALGGNDGLRGVPPEQTAANLEAIIDKARAKNPQIKIVLAGMRMPDNFGTDFNARYTAIFPDLSTRKKTSLVPFLLEGVGGDQKLNQPDRIHPTEEGQHIIAETVWKVLSDQLTP